MPLFPIIFMALITVSCVSGEEKSSSDYIVKSVDQELPPNLWSPRKRTSASYYHYLVGELAFLKSDLGTSTENFNASYALVPNSFTGSKLIASHALNGNKTDSLTESRKMVLLYPKSSDLRVLYGDVLYANKEYEKAAKEFEIAVELDKTNEKAYVSLISVYAQLKKNRKALKFAGLYKKNIGSSANAWLTEARIKLELKDYKGALKSVEVAYEMQSTNPSVILVYAYALEKNKKTKKAISLYEELFRISPQSLELAGKLVQLYRDIDGLEDAYDVLDGISKRSSTSIKAIELQKLFILWELRKNKDAQNLADKLIADFPEDDQVVYAAAYTYLLTKEESKALEIFILIDDDSPFKPNANIYISDILRRQGKKEEAIKVVEKIYKDDNLKLENVRYCSDFFVRLNDYDRAIEVLEVGYEKHPKSYRLLFLQGVYHERVGRVDEALDVMKELIKLDPDNAPALNFLGYVYAEQGKNLDEAKEYLERAIKIEPTNGFYLDSLGWIYFKLGDFENARKYLDEAAKYEPNEGVIYEHLAEIEVKKNELLKAIEYLNKALKSRLEDVDKKRVEKRLKEIQKEAN